MTKKTKKIITILVLVFAAIFIYTYSQDSVGEVAEAEHHDDDDDSVEPYEIYPGDLVEILKGMNEVTLLDVRTLQEHEELHIENSLLLPVQDMSQQALTAIGLGPGTKDKEIYVYCRSGNRSKTAYDIMTSLGYTNVKSVAGGMIHWEEDEYPFTEAGAYVQPEAKQKAESEGSGPRMVLDSNFHDFGTIPQYGGTVSATFTIQNTGTKTLEIGTLTTSCSCTSASAASLTVVPGGETLLTVVFDPDFHEEPLDVFKRTVFIPSNDPHTPEAEVTVQVDIIEGE